ncbi:MAG: 30S ribosomal protein S6 [Chloroflexi bacterium]|nr:30S ribosomal protein S6 [Chloroflexota bacterium]|tara:strand:- start:2558 stop:2944 length:387 start_codon:yes stop_codon:yes gene_type:complete
MGGCLKVQTYELVAILDPRMDADQTAAALAKIDGAVTNGDGQLLANEEWGIRRLSYPIKQFREGNYILRKMRVESSEAVNLNESLRLSEEVIRHLIIKIDNDVDVEAPSKADAPSKSDNDAEAPSSEG